MVGDMAAVFVVVLAGVSAIGWMCSAMIVTALENSRKKPPVLRLKRMSRSLPTTVRDVVCPHCQHRFDIQVTVD